MAIKKPFLQSLAAILLLGCLLSAVGCGDTAPFSSDDASSEMIVISLTPPDSSAGSYQTADGETLYDVIPYSVEDSFTYGEIVGKEDDETEPIYDGPFVADLIPDRSTMEEAFWADSFSSYDDAFFEYYTLVRIRIRRAPEDTIQVNFLALSEEGLIVDCTVFEHMVTADMNETKALLLKVEKRLIADIPAAVLVQQHTRKEDSYGRYYWVE